MTTAETTYARIHANANDITRSIMDDLFDMPAPDEDTNWANVGDMVRIETMLKDVLDVTRGKAR